jgi:succinyl-CoA synthetase beta subunit
MRERVVEIVRRTGMRKCVRAARLLTGRGAPALDRQALVDALCKVSELAVRHHDEFESVEINPFLVRAQGTIALDALIAPRIAKNAGQ